MTGRPVLDIKEVRRLLTTGMTRAAIARHFHVTGAAITQLLSRASVRSRINRPTHLQILECSHCKKEFTRTSNRSYAARYVYCTPDCYFAHRVNPDYLPWRHGQRIARCALRDAGIDLPYHCVVHHHDGNNRNNVLFNLAVFESQSDHMKYHHTGRPLPVWDGRIVG